MASVSGILPGTVTAAGIVPDGFRDERVAGGADQPAQHRMSAPTAMAFLPDGRILVTEKGGKLKLIKNNIVSAAVVLDLTGVVVTTGDSGLIGVAVDNDFARTGYIYVTYVNNSPREGRLARFTMSGDTITANTQKVLLTTLADRTAHVINSVKVGADGLLYVSAGDSASFDSATVEATRAIDPAVAAGKVFRMTRDGKGIASNPYWTGNANDTASKVMALGLRNPFRFSVQANGDVLVGDVGWNNWEEINRIPAHGTKYNFGWPCYEGANNGSKTMSVFSNYPLCKSLLSQGTGAVVAPSYAYDHTVGSSVVGGPIYTGNSFPAEYRGAYFFGDYKKSWINYWKTDASGNFVGQPIRFGTIDTPVDIQNGPNGALYYLSIMRGELRRITYAATPVCAAGTYTAKYYTNQAWSGTPAITRCEDAINHDWVLGGPFGASPTDHYSVAWTGRQYFPKGSSSISATSDDGTQVWVDGRLVIDNNAIQPATTKSAQVTFAAAGYHDIQVKYYENTGYASARFMISNSNKKPVPVITAPADGNGFASNKAVSATGYAKDAEDGALSGSALQWQAYLWHCPPVYDASDICHSHPYTSFSGSSGTITAPDTTGDWVYLEIRLTATDSDGASGSTTVRIFPNTCAPGSYHARYYKNTDWSGTPAITRCDQTLDFDWVKSGPFGSSQTDYFTADWRHPHYFPAGASTVTVTSDDGTQVWVDGKMLIDNNGIRPATTKSAKVTFDIAGYHDVYIRYYEAYGYASAKFSVTQ